MPLREASYCLQQGEIRSWADLLLIVFADEGLRPNLHSSDIAGLVQNVHIVVRLDPEQTLRHPVVGLAHLVACWAHTR